MMEVEEVHSYRDADMVPEDLGAEWDDQVMHDDHVETIPEVEMGNEIPDEDIEYDMEDDSGHAQVYAEEAPGSAVGEVAEHTMVADPSAVRLQTPPASEVPKVDVVFTSPEQKLPKDSLPPAADPSSTPATSPVAVVPDNSPKTNPPHEDQHPTPTDTEPPSNHQTADAVQDPTSLDEPTTVQEAVQAVEPVVDDHQPEPEPEHAEYAAEPLASVEQSTELRTETQEPVAEETSAELYPSPVLVTNPSSSALPSFYLFVAPEPSAEDSPPVYLADQPQLYYDPIHQVFEALRELSVDIGISDHVELALCSEPLDLNVSEDNVYAREVSLNDLNILHIGCELEGPLLLRLDQNSPRFILRYRAIMAEIHRISSEGEQAEPTDGAESLTATAHPEEQVPPPEDNDNQTSHPDIPPVSFDGDHTREHEDETSTELRENETEHEGNTVQETPGGLPSPAIGTAGELLHRTPTQAIDSATKANSAVNGRSTSTEPLNDQQNLGSPPPDSAQYDVPDDFADDASRQEDVEDGSYAIPRKRSELDTSSVAASEGVPAYRVTFDVSDDEEEHGHQDDASSLLGDETQTTRFESQMTGPSFMFNTQDGLDIPYHPDMYSKDDGDEADAYAADLELETPLHETGTTDSDQAQPEVYQNDDEEYSDTHEAGPSHAPKSPISELWDEPDELLDYDGDENGYEDTASQDGGGHQTRDDPDEYSSVSYNENGHAEEFEEPNVPFRSSTPVAEQHVLSPKQSWSSHSSKRSFHEDGLDDDTAQLGRSTETKRAKIQ